MFRFSSRSPVFEIALLVLSLLGGVLAGLTLTPTLVTEFPHRLARTRVVLDALHSETPGDSYVVFGDSTAMNAIDGRLLQQLLSGSSPVRHLASPGQSIAETFLLAQEMPNTLEGVVYFVAIHRFFEGEWLAWDKYNAYYLAGYRPSKETQSRILELFPDRGEQMLGAGAWSHRLQGRWAFLQSVDHGVRRLLRQDLQLTRALSDLQMPRTYPEEPDPAKIAPLVESLRLRYAAFPGRPFSPRMSLFDTLIARFSDRSQRVLVVLAPIHPIPLQTLSPDLRSYFDRRMRETAERYGTVFLDLSDFLPPESFADPVHVSRAGADQVTRKVAEALRTPE